MSQHREFESLRLKATTTTLTSFELKNLKAAPVTLVPAPGAGNAVIAMLATLQYKQGSVAYVVPTGEMAVAYGTPSGDYALNPISAQIVLSSDAFVLLINFPTNSDLLSFFENQPLILANNTTDEWTDGDGTLTVNLYYVIAPLV